MALFNFGKKQENNAPVTGIDNIIVLGGGCKSCHTLLLNTQQAAKNLGLDLEVEYITDMEKIMTYGVMQMPLLVVNEKVVSYGKVLSAAQTEDILRKAGK